MGIHWSDEVRHLVLVLTRFVVDEFVLDERVVVFFFFFSSSSSSSSFFVLVDLDGAFFVDDLLLLDCVRVLVTERFLGSTFSVRTLLDGLCFTLRVDCFCVDVFALVFTLDFDELTELLVRFDVDVRVGVCLAEFRDVFVFVRTLEVFVFC